MSKFLEEILKNNKVIRLVQDGNIRIFTLTDDDDIEAFEADIKSLKLILNSLPSTYAGKESEDPAISEKIIVLLMEFLGDYIRTTIDYLDFSDNTNLEVLLSSLNFYMGNKLPKEFSTFINQYK